VSPSPGPARPRGLPPAVVLLLGLLTTAVCLLLLFGPFYPYGVTPGRILQLQLLELLDGRGPYVLRSLLWDRFGLIVTVVLALLLAVLPWRAVRRHRGASDGAGPAGTAGPAPGGGRITRTTTRTVRRTSLTFSDDGRILDEAHPGSGTLDLGVPELRAMARGTGLPWHTDYETEGGARGFLEVLRAVHTGPVGVHRAGTSDPAGPDAAPDPVREAAPGPVREADRAPVSRPEPLAASDEDLPGEDRVPAPLRPSYDPGAVYTPTSLYSSERLRGAADEDEERTR
jgi:hypothetical protein